MAYYSAVGAAKVDIWGTWQERAAADEAAVKSADIGSKMGRVGEGMTVRPAKPIDFSMAKIGEGISGAAKSLTDLFGGKKTAGIATVLSTGPGGQRVQQVKTAGFPLGAVALLAGVGVVGYLLLKKKA